MILEKPLELSTGVEVTWVEVIQVNIDYLSKKAHITKGYWIDETAKVDGKQPVFAESIDLSGNDFPYGEDASDEKSTLNMAYTSAKLSNLAKPIMEGKKL